MSIIPTKEEVCERKYHYLQYKYTIVNTLLPKKIDVWKTYRTFVCTKPDDWTAKDRRLYNDIIDIKADPRLHLQEVENIIQESFDLVNEINNFTTSYADVVTESVCQFFSRRAYYKYVVCAPEKEH